ncbi:ABC transporter substrate-binding protein [Romboutsia maritimum]|uniref:ABC transporter substrate-binding protein n=1 Tax=Romboutsia maritimum TaxID=2020948 RepID=A0A371IS91_9FIRM|nr:zinc ABC transporter substrate-binding protein [Romboutsia maritimum]RDY23344.1 ABC transporter substrate-binding protein [Romboutsia maritimum]
MKKWYISILSILVGIGVMGCSKENKINKTQENKKIKVYTTIFPIYDFTRNIGQDKIDVNYIVPPGGEPHDFEITAKNMKDIQNANLLIKNGLGIDGFADKIKSESKNLKIVVATEGIKPTAYEKEHDNELKHEDVHNHGEYDPHVWLNVDLAIKECENIKKALIEADKNNKDFYERNYNEYTNKLKNLKSKYDEGLSSIKNKNMLVSHDAYGYLCEQYGINQISITGISPNQEPSINKIIELTNFAKDKNLNYVLLDGLVNPKVAKTIASEAKIKTKVLYSIDGLTKQDFDNNEGYISLMEKNLETLKLVLK